MTFSLTRPVRSLPGCTTQSLGLVLNGTHVPLSVYVRTGVRSLRIEVMWVWAVCSRGLRWYRLWWDFQPVLTVGKDSEGRSPQARPAPNGDIIPDLLSCPAHQVEFCISYYSLIIVLCCIIFCCDKMFYYFICCVIEQLIYCSPENTVYAVCLMQQVVIIAMSLSLFISFTIHCVTCVIHHDDMTLEIMLFILHHIMSLLLL